MRVGVFGATGQVGGVMRALLEERDFPVTQVRFFASARSAGTTLPFKGEDVVVEDSATADFSGIDIALFSNGGAASKELAPKVAAAGATRQSTTRAHGARTRGPARRLRVNAADLDDIPKGIVANPNCTTMAAMPVLKPLHEKAGLVRLHVSSYQAVSGSGGVGVRELDRQLKGAYAAGDPTGLALDGRAVAVPEAELYAVPVGFNVVPLAGSVVDDGSLETDEEQKLRNESRKILHAPDLRVSGTCVRVPVFTGHSLAIHAEFADDITPDEARPAQERTRCHRHRRAQPARGRRPRRGLRRRVRADQAAPEGKGLVLFVVGDNLRKGAALNAVQIAEELLARR